MHSRCAAEVFRAEIRRIFAYRADFWLQFLFNIAAHIGVAFYLWKSVFTDAGVSEMNGYTFNGLMFYYLLVPLLGRVIFGSELGAIGREIYDGSLTKFLIYPVNYFSYKIMQYLAHSCVYFVQMIVAIALFILLYGIPHEVHLTPVMMLIVPTLIMAAILNFVIITSLELFAFWADNVWALLVIVRFAVGMLGGGMIPLAFFPAPAQAILEKLPFVYLTSFPADLLMGKISFDRWIEGMVIMAIWIFGVAILEYRIWKSGNLQYTGVGI